MNRRNIMFFQILALIVILCTGAAAVEAKLNVITTTTTMKSLVEVVGGPDVSVQSITDGGQDPHYIEAKPSYMVALRKADLLVSVGLSLEEAWLPVLIRGARNPKLHTEAGHFVAGRKIETIEVPKGKLDRSQGDVHPEGNPHFHLDPDRTHDVVGAIAEHLATLDPQNAAHYRARGKSFQQELKKKLPEWQARIQKSGVKKVVTYHRLMNYFLDRFSIESAGTIETMPGIPPTANHLKQLVETIRSEKVPCILNAHFYDLEAARKIQKMTSIRVEAVGTEVGARSELKDYFSLIEQLVRAIEICGKNSPQESLGGNHG